MKTQTINRFNKADREFIINSEGRLREIREEVDMIDRALNGQGIFEDE